MNNDGLTVLILAGGFGTRLSKVLADRPKALAEVNGRPFITYIFDQLIDAGLNNIIVCTGYMSEKIVATIGNNYKNIKILYSKEEIPLGTAGAARRAALYVSNKTMMIMNGDSYINTDFK